MYVTITQDDVSTVQDHGSVVRITGTGENGERVTFAGDHRPMGHLIEALLTDQEDEVTVEVEDWQILGGERPMNAPRTSVCKHCDSQIECIDGVGWVDVLSGDEGGTYDICPETYDAETDTNGSHTPKEN